MGSYSWDNPCGVQYYNGRPLSVALMEPCQCDAGPASCVQSDFTTNFRPRSHSSGRRFQRESFSIYRPNVQYASFCYSPPFSRQIKDYSSARDMFVEKFETVTIEEQQCRPSRCCNYVCTPAPIIRQVKIRSRPSSCVNLHKKEAAATDNQWSKVVDERHEEHHDWNYNISVPIERAASFDHSAVVSLINDLRNSSSSKTAVRPSTRDATTLTDVSPKKLTRPLSISETQVLDRYEKNERIRRDSITENTGSISSTVFQRPSNRLTDGSRSYNALNIYSDRGKNQMIVRPTAKPREALVDAPSIVAPPGDSEPSTPITIETSYQTRNYYY